MQNVIENKLNLARKWRSKNFEEVVGQDLAVKILRNSLYLGHFFPVYLFSGQRGCGKTSAARIFAAAVNCANLEKFQKEPKQFPLPCLVCASCSAMQETRHPDFIEMDAASHTGVDNIRHIIESSSFLPVLGKKKIYLIDEAHMLSKSAFNAFLKLLEEPPVSVLFILATTDPDKIIETVKSRCFQIFFNYIDKNSLVAHLKSICDQELIRYDDQGLEVIYKQSQGSARDAINLLERVRFSTDKVTKESVQRVLGQPSDDDIVELLMRLARKETFVDLLVYFDSIHIDRISLDYLFTRCIEIAQQCVYMKHGVTLQDLTIHHDQLALMPTPWLVKFLDLFIAHEQLFQKTTNKRVLIELLCIKIIDVDMASSLNAPQVSIEYVEKKNEIKAVDQRRANLEHQKKSHGALDAVPVADQQTTAVKSDLWSLFLERVLELEDPLLTSLFKQAEFHAYDESRSVVTIFIDKKFAFFQYALEDNRALWLKIMRDIFGPAAELETVMKEGIVVEQKPTMHADNAGLRGSLAKEDNEAIKTEYAVKKKVNMHVKSLDISDKEVWKLSNALLEIIPGKINQIEEGDNE